MGQTPPVGAACQQPLHQHRHGVATGQRHDRVAGELIQRRIQGPPVGRSRNPDQRRVHHLPEPAIGLGTGPGHQHLARAAEPGAGGAGRLLVPGAGTGPRWRRPLARHRQRRGAAAGGAHRCPSRPDHRHQGGRQRVTAGGCAQRQRGHRLVGAAGVADQGDRRCRAPSSGQKLLGYHRHPGGGHVIDQGIGHGHRHLRVPGAESHRRGLPAPRQGQLRVGGGRHRGSNARNHLVGDAGGTQEADLLGAAREQQRVAALEMSHPASGRRLFRQQPVQALLPFRRRCPAVA